MTSKPTTIDAYFAGLTAEKRAALEGLRRQIKSIAPKAEECISYGIPAFRLDGRVLVWFNAAAKHCSFFPGALPIKTHADALAKYETSKGTIRFQPEKPLPITLVRKLVKTRIAELVARTELRSASVGGPQSGPPYE